MVPLLLLLALLWGGSLQRDRGYELRVQESVTVQACGGVHVPCSFSYPWSSWYFPPEPYIYWFREGDNVNTEPVATNNPNRRVKPETQGRFRLLGDPWKNNCSLSIRDARMSDTGVYLFRVEREPGVRYTYRDKRLNLQVTVPAGKPNIHFLEPLESGRPTNLTCSLSLVCEVEQFLLFSWVGDALDAVNTEALHSSVLTLTPRPQDHGTNLTCRVELRGAQVTMERTIRLSVSYAPWNLTISISFRNVTALKILQNTSSLLISEGQALQLLCVADSNPPAQLSWFRGSPALKPTPISNTRILELPGLGAAEREFTCRAQNTLGSQNTSLSLSVFYPPQLLGPSCSQEEEGLHCSCSSRAQPASSLHWWLAEGLLEENFSNTSFKVTSSSSEPWANSSLSLTGGLRSGLRLTCEARNIHGAQSATVLLQPGKPASLTGVVPAALGGAGGMALLSLCLCLIFFCIVKAHRKQAASRQEHVDDEDPVMGTVSWGCRQKPWAEGPPDQRSSPAEDALPSGEQQELHYASLSFHGMKSWETSDQEATSTSEYSEIKTS
ncbi:sialic acid-binding Ig-like lectin 5 isoform X1 [Hippopotamus amphibius kiboko]|uniref:sialic acid-binding Ig-like lectin 5 isoform X1 n=1 Tax=Hippopotamus amphibius kiboko TaxID=575201 RepID=UPI0025954D11|nr:sialic acid-binding Ig-like lectin 5 isoform X1 [Hippopotamus amphibius kiboko]